MNPKNYKNFYDDIAKESEVHKDLVSDFVFFFYDKVRKNLSNLTSPKIALPNLGTFSIRINKLKKSIQRQQDILGNLDKTKFTGYDKSVPVKKKLESMKNILKVIDQNIEDKKKFKNENK
tara:strand:- start:2086 stop:2445 length:360 start_codon:yes stop_codon:yes gene_type:complete